MWRRLIGLINKGDTDASLIEERVTEESMQS
jgi:hypothetical protein